MQNKEWKQQTHFHKMKSWFVGHPRRIIHNFWTIFLLEDCQDFMEQHFDLAIIQIAAGINLRLTMFDFSNPFFFLILFDIYWDSSFGVQCLIIFRQKTFVSMRQTSNAFAPPRSRVAPSRNSMSLKLANPISTKTKPTQNGCVIVCLKMRFLTREVCVWGNPSVFRGFVSGYASRLSPQVEKENEGSVSGVRFRGKFRQNWTSQHYALSSTQRLQTIINTARL